MMTVDDLRVVMGDLATSTKRYIREEITAVLDGVGEKLAALEAKLAAVQLTPGPMGPQGDPGEKGADGIGIVGPKGDQGERGADGIGLIGPKGDTGERGRDAEPPDLDVLAQKAATLIPRPMDGAPGRDAVIDLDALAAKAAALIPAPQHGINGKNADPVDLDALAVKVAALMPLPRDGINGKDAAPIDLHDVAIRAAALIPTPTNGADGIGVAGAVIDRAGRLILTLSNGTTQELGAVVGRDGASADPSQVKAWIAEEVAKIPRPKDGVNGKDGTTFDGFDVSFDDQDGPIMHIKQGAQSVAARVPWMFDAGVWRATTKFYPKCAAVSWNGSLWIAQRDAHGEKPGDGSGVWRLAVKAGRDAKPPREGS